MNHSRSVFFLATVVLALVVLTSENPVPYLSGAFAGFLFRAHLFKLTKKPFKIMPQTIPGITNIKSTVPCIVTVGFSLQDGSRTLIMTAKHDESIQATVHLPGYDPSSGSMNHETGPEPTEDFTRQPFYPTPAATEQNNASGPPSNTGLRSPLRLISASDGKPQPQLTREHKPTNE